MLLLGDEFLKRSLKFDQFSEKRLIKNYKL